MSLPPLAVPQFLVQCAACTHTSNTLPIRRIQVLWRRAPRRRKRQLYMQGGPLHEASWCPGCTRALNVYPHWFMYLQCEGGARVRVGVVYGREASVSLRPKADGTYFGALVVGG